MARKVDLIELLEQLKDAQATIAEVAKAEQRATHAQNVKVDVEEEIASLKDELETIRDQRNEQQKTFDLDLNRLKKRYKETSEGLETAYKARKDEIEKELSALSNTLSKAKLEHNAQIKEMQAERDSLKNEVGTTLAEMRRYADSVNKRLSDFD